LAESKSDDRVQVLRAAFDATMKDPDFFADTKKSRIDLEPTNCEEVQIKVGGMFKLSRRWWRSCAMR
jgi:hypothetical protein